MTQDTGQILNAYLDGELGPDEAVEIEELLASDPELAAQFERDLEIKGLLSDALDQAADRPANLHTRRLTQRLARRVLARSQGERSLAGFRVPPALWQSAAALALVVGGMWGYSTVQSTTGPVPEYVAEAVGAHQVFAQDASYPVEFTGPDVETATEWFSRKLGVAVSTPSVQNGDFTLLGARLLGTKEGPMAQFLYETRDGERVTLTLSKHDQADPLSDWSTVTYPRQSVGYWSSTDIDFTLVAERDADLASYASNMGLALAAIDE